MALPGDELERRVKAAAALRGLGMRSLRDALGDYGANRSLAEAMIRGDAPQNRKNIHDLAEALEIPEVWFTAEDWQVLVADSESARQNSLEEMSDQVTGLASIVDSLVSEVQRLSRQLPRSGEETGEQ